MRTIQTYNNLVWVDLESPTKDEVRDIVENFSIHGSVAEELILPSIRDRVDLYPNCIYVILHFPAEGHTNSLGTNQEIDFIIGKDFLITAHYDTIDAIHKFSKVFEANGITHGADIGDHAGYIFYLLIQKLYGSIEHELDKFESDLNEIEEQMFAGKEKKMVENISRLGRIILDFKRTVSLHRSVLQSLETAGIKFFGNSFVHFFKKIEAEQFKIYSLIEGQQESLKEIRETNNSMLSSKENEVMKTLTIMAFVTFPLSLIATIFGMNTVNMPIIGGDYDFWIVIGIMAIFTFAFFVFFKKNRWL